MKQDREAVPERCPDGGTCHHNCPGDTHTDFGDPIVGQPCFRVLTCGPLSGVFTGDRWPEHVKRTHRLAGGQCPNHGNRCTPEIVPTPAEPDVADPAGPDTTGEHPAPTDDVERREQIAHYLAVHLVDADTPLFAQEPDPVVWIDVDLITNAGPRYLSVTVAKQVSRNRLETEFAAEIHQPTLETFSAQKIRWRGFIEHDNRWQPVILHLGPA